MGCPGDEDTPADAWNMANLYFRSKVEAYFWKILGENSAGKFPDFREIFPREIPRIPENPGNFRKKRVKNDRFWKN